MSGVLHEHPYAPGNGPEVGCPSSPRWGGEKPAITPARELEITERRRYLRAVREQTLERFAMGEQLDAGVRVSPFLIALELARAGVARAEDLELIALRLFGRLVELAAAGYAGAIATHAELAARFACSGSTVRRGLEWLLEVGLVERVCATYSCNRCNKPSGTCEHGVQASSSRRANAYRVPDAVLGGIASLLKNEQASGTERSDKNAIRPEEMPAQAVRRPPCAAPARQTTRPPKARPAPPEASQAVVTERGLELRAELAARAAAGDTFAAELLAERTQDAKHRVVVRDPEHVGRVWWRMFALIWHELGWRELERLTSPATRSSP